MRSLTPYGSKYKQALDAIAALAEEVKSLKDMVGQVPEEVTAELEQAKKKLEQLELALASQSNTTLLS